MLLKYLYALKVVNDLSFCGPASVDQDGLHHAFQNDLSGIRHDIGVASIDRHSIAAVPISVQ
jgi:hypothetical protein